MSIPFYVSPEQLMRDRADFARKGIARGRSVVVVQYADGILFVAENPSPALHKVAEIYDRIAFAAVGRYNEFENLRIAGVRLADMRGYSYDRRDVTGRAWPTPTPRRSARSSPPAVRSRSRWRSSSPRSATRRRRPDLPAHLRRLDRRRARLRRDGRPGRAGADYVGEHYQEGSRSPARSGWPWTRSATTAPGPELTADQIEVAVLDRTRTQPRKFRRIEGPTGWPTCVSRSTPPNSRSQRG